MNIQQFDYSVDLLRVLLWEYNDAEAIQTLLTKKQEWYDINQTAFWEDWYNDVFNLVTANDFGLAVWSIILNTPLQIGIGPDPEGKPIFGFGTETADPNGNVNFSNGNFSNGDNSLRLTTEEKRLILRLRYFQLQSRTATPEINTFLNILFESFPGTAYVLDGLDMTIRVVFTYNAGTRLFFILESYDLIPRGSGVGVSYTFALSEVFGFGIHNKNFTNGCFQEDT